MQDLSTRRAVSSPALCVVSLRDNLTHQEIVGVCPECNNRIRIPIYPVVNSETIIKDLEYIRDKQNEIIEKQKQEIFELKQSSFRDASSIT